MEIISTVMQHQSLEAHVGPVRPHEGLFWGGTTGIRELKLELGSCGQKSDKIPEFL